jgi:hypothetical protein
MPSFRIAHVRAGSFLLATLALLACGDSGYVPVSTDDSMIAADMEMAPAPEMALSKQAGVADGSASAVAEAMSANAQATSTGSSDTTATVIVPSMIIRDGAVSVRVDSLEPAIAAVQAMATSLGGYVGNTQMYAGARQTRSATLELKIPAARFDAALAGLEPLGQVESVSSTAQDVGEEFVDVSARVANSQRLEDRLVTLLATRAGKLEDVLAVERELARVREEIERYTGRLRYLRSRVSISTLTVTVHEPAPIISGSGVDNVMTTAFKNAWRNFVGFVAGFISLLGVIVPSVVLLVLALLAWRRLRRPRAP